MRNIVIFLSMGFLFLFQSAPVSAGPFHKKIFEKAHKSSKSIQVKYSEKIDEKDWNKMIFEWAVENDWGQTTQWDCRVDETTKVLNSKKQVPFSEFSQWQDKGKTMKSFKALFDYSFRNKKQCREIHLSKD